MDSEYGYMFNIRFTVFDNEENDFKIKKLLNNLKSIVKNALPTINTDLCLLDNVEYVSIATLDHKKQLRSMSPGDYGMYKDKNCVHLIQHGSELFTLRELTDIAETIKVELREYLCHDIDTEIYLDLDLGSN